MKNDYKYNKNFKKNTKKGSKKYNLKGKKQTKKNGLLDFCLIEENPFNLKLLIKKR